MNKPYSPFERPEPPAPNPQREADRALLLAALGAPAGQRWLAMRLAAELGRPSYQPGDDPALVAWREGRKAMLSDIQRELMAATTPNDWSKP